MTPLAASYVAAAEALDLLATVRRRVAKVALGVGNPHGVETERGVREEQAAAAIRALLVVIEASEVAATRRKDDDAYARLVRQNLSRRLIPVESDGGGLATLGEVAADQRERAAWAERKAERARQDERTVARG